MIILKTILFLLIFAGGVVCIIYKNKLAIKLQKLYIRQSIKLYGNSGKWELPWALILFKVMIIFAGIILIIGAYPIVFGPVYLNF
jgi:uncharacterized membrane protein